MKKLFALLMVAAMTASVTVASFGADTDADDSCFMGGGGEGDMSGASGSDTLVVRRGNSYYISNSLKSDAADQEIDYG
ncbi:MAG: hypothetical protein LIO80_01815 [Lachnospiraceae bacterium]|nr:hypothetical protein [Lachnospiraceae bacterium]